MQFTLKNIEECNEKYIKLIVNDLIDSNKPKWMILFHSEDLIENHIFKFESVLMHKLSKLSPMVNCSL